MDALVIGALDPHRDGDGVGAMHLVQIVQVHLECIERAAGAGAVGGVEANAVHQRIDGETYDEAVVAIAQMTVEVDPLRQDRGLMDGDARHVQESFSRSRVCAGVRMRAPMASMMVRAFSTSCALLA